MDKTGAANVDFLLADAEAVSFPEHSFDLILCSNGMAYLQDIPAAVKKFNSWLKPGGKLCFNNPQVPCKYRALVKLDTQISRHQSLVARMASELHCRPAESTGRARVPVQTFQELDMQSCTEIDEYL